MAWREYATGALWTDRAFNHFAGVWRLELGAFVAAFVAVGVILVIDCDFGNLGLRFDQV